MGDFLLAIWADRNTCKPYTGPGRIGHVVRVSPNPHMTIVDEFTDGGRFQHSDCGPASLDSWLIDETPVRVGVKELEQLAGTGPNGTSFDGLIAAASHFGYAVTFSPNDPEPGCVMNPGGFLEGEQAFPSYLAASQGGCLVLPVVASPHPPTPQPKPAPGALMKATFFQGPDSTIYLFVPTGKGQFIPLNEIAVVKALAADWGISETPIALNAADVAAWRAAYPPS